MAVPGANFAGKRVGSKELSLVCEIVVISFKNGVLLGSLESRNFTKKTILLYLIHFGVILQRTYVATFLSLHIGLWT